MGVFDSTDDPVEQYIENRGLPVLIDMQIVSLEAMCEGIGWAGCMLICR